MAERSPVALVTGATGGIGRVICADLAKHGYTVAEADLAGAVPVDLRDGDSCRAAVQTTVDRFGGLVDRIVLTPKEEDGRRSLSIDLEGALAGVLALAINGKKPLTGSGSSDAVITLVAGAGFEPATFRL